MLSCTIPFKKRIYTSLYWTTDVEVILERCCKSKLISKKNTQERT